MEGASEDFGDRIDRAIKEGFSDEEILMQIGPENHELLVALIRVRKDTKQMFVVVHGESYIPEAFGNKVDADEFAKESGDNYISGPWTINTGDQEEEEEEAYAYRIKHVECSIDGTDYVEYDQKLDKEILRRPSTPEEISHFRIVDGIDGPEGQQEYTIVGYYRDNDQPYTESVTATTPAEAAKLGAWECAQNNHGYCELTVVEVLDASGKGCLMSHKTLEFFFTEEDTHESVFGDVGNDSGD